MSISETPVAVVPLCSEPVALVYAERQVTAVRLNGFGGVESLSGLEFDGRPFVASRAQVVVELEFGVLRYFVCDRGVKRQLWRRSEPGLGAFVTCRPGAESHGAELLTLPRF